MTRPHAEKLLQTPVASRRGKRLPRKSQIGGAVGATLNGATLVVAHRDPCLPEVPSDVEHSSARISGWEGIEQETSVAAGSDVNVLISGGSPQARAMLARRIHQESPRRDQPFIAAELRGRANWRLESPRRGWLFIEEVNDLTWRMQVCLLGFLERRLCEPGAIRVIASTSPELFSKVRSRSFSLDLFYRLNTIHLVL